MGTYIYGLKKASRNIRTVDGDLAKVQHYSYMYKQSFSMFPSNQYTRITGLKETRAQHAFEDYNNAYVVRCDEKDDDTGKATDLDYQYVYNNVQKASTDDYDFSEVMDYVGYLKKSGRSYVLHEAVTTYEREGYARVTAYYYPRWSKDDSGYIHRLCYKFTNLQTGEVSKMQDMDSQSQYHALYQGEEKIAERIYSMVI
jgi:hypothetical protein